MRYKKGIERMQTVLLPETLEDYVNKDNPVRAIEAFVERLDLKELGFVRAEAASTGRMGYDPRDMLKLYMYGYLNGVRSSRRLERESGVNLELMWLMRKLQPDFKTIADFRKNNQLAIRGVFREFVSLCRGLDLFDGKVVSVDGSKFKAVNAKDKNYYEEKLKKLKERAEAKIDEYLRDLDEADKAEEHIIPKKMTADELKEKIELMKKRMQRYEKVEEDLKNSGEKQVSQTDPDSRLMPSNHKFEVGYNVQTTVEGKHKLILDFEVTNTPSDRDQLAPMGIRAKEILGVEALDVLGDTGYWEAGQILKCKESALTPFVPRRDEKGLARKRKIFPKEKFYYNKEKDLFVCPAGNEMPYSFSAYRKATDKTMRYYRTTACFNCSFASKCTTDKRGLRRMDRWEHEEVLEEMAERMAANPLKYRLRQQLSEHPFGTIKRALNQGYFLTKRFAAVTAEYSLSALVYDLKRVISILGTNRFVEALT